MISLSLSQKGRRCAALFGTLLVCTTGPVTAKYPELGGPKQFDLSCSGQEVRVLDGYIPVPNSGTGHEEPRVKPARNHLKIDMISMQFLETGQYHPAKIPLEKDGILYLHNEPATSLWTINLDTYRSIFVRHFEDGTLYVEKMKCRLAKFSGFPFVPSSVEEVREMMKRQK